MKIFPDNYKKFNQLLTSFYYTALIILLVAMALFYYSVKSSFTDFRHPEKYLIISFSIIILSFISTYFIQQNLLKRAAMQGTVKEKLQFYLIITIVKTIIFVTTGFLNLAFFLITQNKIFLFFTAYSVLMLLLMRPNEDKMIEDLLLTIHEKEFITNPERKFD